MLYDPKDFSSYEGVLEPEGPEVWFDPEIGSDVFARFFEGKAVVSWEVTDTGRGWDSPPW